MGKADIEFLRYVPIFADLTDLELERITKLGSRKKFSKGGIILLEKESAASMFVIVTGKVKVVRMDEEGREVILSILGESDFFGEMAILDGQARSATVVALNKTEIFVIQRHDFLKLIHSHPIVGIALLRELTSRLRKADAQIKSLSLKDALGRVATVILQISDDIGIFRKGRVEIDDLPMQQDLANMAGTSRETVSRTLHRFIKKGQLQLQGNKLIICDYEQFKQQYT
ncbi:MAG: Crp/Fnr family transcriptional regulator [Ignavibacteria bacterium]|nr:Crp/Fnr family transcriptional regulator [Bacteroidota bacterium]MSQ45703.1 Crp/Fnr family transcriptional regulator [Ignavibacteria bacterium]